MGDKPVLKRFLLVLTAFIVIPAGIIAAIAATRPDTFRVERSLAIKAAPEQIYPQIESLRGFASWSPYEKKDPQMKRTFSGPESGKGAVYAWNGNGDVGEGRLEVTNASAPSAVTMELAFVRPFEARNTVEFTLAPQGEETVVTWAMHGSMPFLSRMMCVVFDMDEMVGSDFAVGLANLKEQVEGRVAAYGQR